MHEISANGESPLSFITIINFYWDIVALQRYASFCFQRMSQLHGYIYPLFSRFSAHLGPHTSLSRVPCGKL